jgi:hypothetical protein
MNLTNMNARFRRLEKLVPSATETVKANRHAEFDMRLWEGLKEMNDKGADSLDFLELAMELEKSGVTIDNRPPGQLGVGVGPMTRSYRLWHSACFVQVRYRFRLRTSQRRLLSVPGAR